MNIFKAKLLLVVLTLTTANLATAGAVNSKTYEAQDNSIESKICVAAATASNARMNSTVKQMSSTKLMHTKYTLIANEIRCNGINVADFAAQAGNIEVAKKLKSYRTKNVEILDIATTYTGNVSVSE
ncbi:MAG: hypothetical protein ACJA0G_001031 [Kangiellaceae bacterium]|jgi:hypothetical protein